MKFVLAGSAWVWIAAVISVWMVIDTGNSARSAVAIPPTVDDF